MSELGPSGLPVPPPSPNLETQRFWDGTAEGRLELPRCDNCGHVVWYPRERCDQCGSTSVTSPVLASTWCRREGFAEPPCAVT